MKLFFDKMIGRGSAGEVWQATDGLGRPIAVKFFHADDPASVRRDAEAHAQALHRVNHPSVVRLYAVENQPDPDSGDEKLAIVMERVPGVTLNLHEGEIDFEVARLAVSQLQAGLEAIHASGMVHGDLHTGNVVISGSGAKIIDILYTHSLREVGSRVARQNRKEDLREFATLVQKILEKTAVGRAAARVLSDARFQAESAGTPAEVVRAFDRVLRRARSADCLPRLVRAVVGDATGPAAVPPRLSEDQVAVVDHAVDAILTGDRFQPITGRELRAHMNGTVAQRVSALASLDEYLEREGASFDRDTYRPTPLGLLLSSSGDRFRLVLEATLDALRGKIAAHPGFRAFSMGDVQPALVERGIIGHEGDDDFISRVYILFGLCVRAERNDGIQTWSCPNNIEQIVELETADDLATFLQPPPGVFATTSAANAGVDTGAPVQEATLFVDYRRISLTQERHQYELVARLTNGPRKRLVDWYIEVEMPAPPLRAVGATFAAKVDSRSSDRRWLLRTSRGLGPLAAGDEYSFKVPYIVNQDMYWKHRETGLFEEQVVARLFVLGELMDEIEMPFGQLQTF